MFLKWFFFSPGFLLLILHQQFSLKVLPNISERTGKPFLPAPPRLSSVMQLSLLTWSVSWWNRVWAWQPGMQRVMFLASLLSENLFTLPRTPWGICCPVLWRREIRNLDGSKQGQGGAISPAIMKCSHEVFSPILALLAFSWSHLCRTPAGKRFHFGQSVYEHLHIEQSMCQQIYTFFSSKMVSFSDYFVQLVPPDFTFQPKSVSSRTDFKGLFLLKCLFGVRWHKQGQVWREKSSFF